MGVPAREAGPQTTDRALLLIERARSRDGKAFEELVAPYRGELEAHCYRVLGSLTDAEDALQESLAAAWDGLQDFRGEATVRTWLYRVTTRRCLNILRSGKRRRLQSRVALGAEPPEPTRLGEVVWLEPYPDSRLEQIVDPSAGPEARYERREAISLAFITALQLLPPQPRAILILRDVLDFSARETAAILETTAHTVNSALRRARAKLVQEPTDPERTSAAPKTPEEHDLLDRLVNAWENADVRALVDLMTENVWLRMPPRPFEYQGLERAGRWFSTVVFRDGRRFKLVPTRANGQPAFGLYRREPLHGIARASGLAVVTLSGGRICAITHFESRLLHRFGLPRTIRDDGNRARM